MLQAIVWTQMMSLNLTLYLTFTYELNFIKKNKAFKDELIRNVLQSREKIKH